MQRVNAVALVTVLALAGCARPVYTHPDGTTICGVRVPTGAMAAVAWPLRSPGPDPATGPAPVTSVLPATGPGVPRYSSATYVRTSKTCDHGAVVVVQPWQHAHLVVTIPAKDGRIAALGLRVTGPATVRCWVGGVFAGSASLPLG